MKPEQKAIRLGSIMLITAILLRLLGNIPFSPAGAAQMMIFFQTGRLVSADSQQAVEIIPAETVTVTVHTPQAPAAVFSPEDAALVSVQNTTSYPIEPDSLLTQPLKWDLRANGPTVLILHAHATESYADTQGYRSPDETQNMLAIGDRLAELLEARGIGVIHDRTLHDETSYSGSYDSARTSISQYLSQYPTIRLVLDLHRDAAEDAQGNQIGYTVATENGDAAKLVFVVGTDAGGQNHPAWQENLSLAVKLHATLQKLCPDICRPLQVRTSCYNQDLSTGAVLVEVGTAGNTQQEAMLTVELLAQGILALAAGANL